MSENGKIIRISGPVVIANNMKGARMYELVKVGKLGLIGEIIELNDDEATIQVYEETSGMKPDEGVISTGNPLSVELGPGLIGSIYDGTQRPLNILREESGDYISRGILANPLDRTKKWKFTPIAKKGDHIQGGDSIGEVKESNLINHKIMVPPKIKGELVEIAPEDEYIIEDIIYKVKVTGEIKEFNMIQIWPVRKPRPIKKKLRPDRPLITGQRIIDTLFPIAKGGTCAIPGGFGTGKTVIQHELAKWSDAQMVTYIGCGERGNEMCDVLESFPKLIDPRSGEPLLARTTLIANTSNMPVAAREASVYTGITIAEYFRDMGYDVSLMADSSSRWAEALREISGRLEEMPGEEGFPAYLASKLASFYERAGRVEVIGSEKKVGSISVTAAVSPPGGDFSEPVTQNTLRVVKVFWGLDADLADRRHFPSINWLKSYSLYIDSVQDWWNSKVSANWKDTRTKAMQILEHEDELKEVVQLVGPDALPEREKAVLFGARIIREDFLQQNAFHEIDTFCSYKKQFGMLTLILNFYDSILAAVDRGVLVKELEKMKTLNLIARLKIVPEDQFDDHIKSVDTKIKEEVNTLVKNIGA